MKSFEDLLNSYIIDEKIFNNYNGNLDKITNYIQNDFYIGNQMLYNLCREHFEHKNRQDITAKIWLIGRSYAASVERRKKYKNYKFLKFWDILLEDFEKFALKIDNNLKIIKDVELSNENIRIVLNTHKCLVECFNESTNLNKRSLASKYLHFHCPKLFFIYDSRARTAINHFVKKISKINLLDFTEFDEEYFDFYIRCLKLKYHIDTTYKKYSPRQIDMFLLHYDEDKQTPYSIK